MSIFDSVNRESEDAVASLLGLKVAKDGKSYECPICGHGKGGDGIKQDKYKGKLIWHCYGTCGGHWTNADLICVVHGIKLDDKAAMAKKLAELYPEYDDSNFSSSRDKSERRSDGNTSGSVKKMEQKSASTAASTTEPKNYAKLYEYCRQNYSLKKFVDSQGGKWRGLTLATLEKAGALYHAEYMFAEDNKQAAIILPKSDSHCFVRAVEGKDRRHQGQGAGLYEALPISTNSVNFIVEGELDALSISQAVSGGAFVTGVGVIATGGASKWRKVVTELEKRFGNAEKKPRFIVAFDYDDAGEKNGAELVKDLIAAGYPAESFFFQEDKAGRFETYDPDGNDITYTVDKIDANDLLREKGEEFGNYLIDVMEQTERRLEDTASAIKASREAAKEAEIKAEKEKKILAEQERQVAMDKSGMKVFSFTEYFKADFFSDIALTSKYAKRKTGFENVDAEQVFMPGMYVLGALPATGKTTFAWQLLNQLADNGEFCIYCSFEMSHTELFIKSIARELYQNYSVMSERLSLSSVNIRRGACRGIEELQEQADVFVRSSTNLHVIEPSNMGVAELIAKLKPLIADVDKSPVICLDYLQIIPPSKGVKTSSTREKIDDAVLRLKNFQRETNSTLIVISGFNRENYYQPVSFCSFKESGAIEYTADVIWGLENHGVGANGEPSKEEVIKMSKEKIRKIKFSCLKNRNGGQYECYFDYYAAHDYFEPCDRMDGAQSTRHDY